MTVILGEGGHRYRVVEDWAKLPDGWEFRDVGAVAVDSSDQVYVFNRGEHPMMVFDRDGNFPRSWGEDLFQRAHGLHTPTICSTARTMARTRCASAHLMAKYF